MQTRGAAVAVPALRHRPAPTAVHRDAPAGTIGALAGILAAYLIFDLPWLTLPPMLFALLTVAKVRRPRTVTVAAAAVP